MALKGIKERDPAHVLQKFFSGNAVSWADFLCE